MIGLGSMAGSRCRARGEHPAEECQTAIKGLRSTPSERLYTANFYTLHPAKARQPKHRTTTATKDAPLKTLLPCSPHFLKTFFLHSLPPPNPTPLRPRHIPILLGRRDGIVRFRQLGAIHRGRERGVLWLWRERRGGREDGGRRERDGSRSGIGGGRFVLRWMGTVRRWIFSETRREDADDLSETVDLCSSARSSVGEVFDGLDFAGGRSASSKGVQEDVRWECA